MLTPYDDHYRLIKEMYEDKQAKRSGVPYMNHIDEGIIVLTAIQSSITAQQAFCLHPIFQNDGDLAANYEESWQGLNRHAIIAAMEYRNIANQYLSQITVSTLEEIKLSPLKDVNDMLIADKVQNFKDFEVYHQQTHPRRDELRVYFKMWLRRLGISPDRYLALRGLIAGPIEFNQLLENENEVAKMGARTTGIGLREETSPAASLADSD
jgi:(p)ppGpp synthase/HD superfamily hydrolase